MNRKGDGDAMFKLFFGLVALIAIFFVLAMVWPTASNVFSQVTGTLTGLSTTFRDNGMLSANDSVAATQSITAVDTGVQNSSWIPYTFFVGLIVIGSIFAYNAKTNPWLLPVWILAIIFCTYMSIGFTQNYEANINNPIYAGQDPFTDLLARNLHTIVPVVGAIFGILMFIIIQKEPEYEVQQQ